MVCLGILWNGMQEYVDESINDINAYGKVKEAFTLHLGDQYESFVRTIYAQDEIAEWKVDKKVETMFQCSDSRDVTIFIADIDTKEKEYHPFKKRDVYINLENMKVNLRDKYGKLVKHYFFDNVMHVTDDEREYVADSKVVASFIEKGIDFTPIDLEKKNEKDKVNVYKREDV